MQCSNCQSSIRPTDTKCQRCGVPLVPQRVILGKEGDEFMLTAEEENSEIDNGAEKEPWQFPLEPKSESAQQVEITTADAIPEVRWGGFLRRTMAFVADLIILSGLSAVMFWLSYIGYKVGLSAHGRAVTWENAEPLFVLLTWGWIGLTTGYFVLFHGMDGKTIGKKLLKLRVVGPDQKTLTYRRALLRWIGAVGFAPMVLGFLWVLWSRESRAWHDILARTWVIRE
jgi:uncharacterized RDD family membrane protein YckC